MCLNPSVTRRSGPSPIAIAARAARAPNARRGIARSATGGSRRRSARASPCGRAIGLRRSAASDHARCGLACCPPVRYGGPTPTRAVCATVRLCWARGVELRRLGPASALRRRRHGRQVRRLYASTARGTVSRPIATNRVFGAASGARLGVLYPLFDHRRIPPAGWTSHRLCAGSSPIVAVWPVPPVPSARRWLRRRHCRRISGSLREPGISSERRALRVPPVREICQDAVGQRGLVHAPYPVTARGRTEYAHLQRSVLHVGLG